MHLNTGSGIVVCSALAVLLALPFAVAAQQTAEGPFVPPIAGQWDPIVSLGQPPRWQHYVGVGIGAANPFRAGPVGVTGTAGIYRDITNPVVAMLGVAAEVYAGQRGSRFDPGARLQLVSPALYVRAGIDWNQRLRSADAAFGLTVPPARGGWFGQGGQLRFDYLPTRDHELVAGVTLPVGRHHATRTRPRHVSVALPRAAPPPRGAADTALLASMRWITQLQTFVWRMGDGPIGHEASVAHVQRVLRSIAGDIAARTPPAPGRSVYDAVVEGYHASLAAAFATVEQGDAGDGFDAAQEAAAARRIVLEEVVLPYNRLVGQRREPDELHGLAARARARFLARLLLRETSTRTVDSALAVFDDWLHNFERVRADLAASARDPRQLWLPLALVLRPDDHATQAQVDALVETALGRSFTTGNTTRYIDALQFQVELTRTLHETRDYHVLWVHDYRGRNEAGAPDRAAFVQTTDGYLSALVQRVREYDETGSLPSFIMMIDQHSYEEHNARLWLDLLERPLTHRMRLPAQHRDMQVRIELLQDSLRAAVAASRRLSADARAFGDRWLEQVVRVHVNVTFPSDLSYRAPRALQLPPFAGDNMMRDHRKIVIRDITEADPDAGEVILTGVGVGERYATTLWDDRGIVITGPAALEARAAARAVLRAHGLSEPGMPAPLLPDAFAEDHADRVAAREAMGAAARALQVHNATGFGDKDATFLHMLLYDLAPAGTVLYIPDSLWLSFHRLGQLVQAAMRGCHVLIVAPALSNAPNTGFPQLSRMQELVVRAVLVQDELGGIIRSGGGDFRVGLYSRETRLDDVAGAVADLERAWAEAPFMAQLFPLRPSVWNALAVVHAEAQGARRPLSAASPYASVASETQGEQRPMLHRKTQLLASGEALAVLGSLPGLDELFAEKLRRLGAGRSAGLPPDEASAALPALYGAAVSEGMQHGGQPLLYLMAGSMNMDPRSALLDGEATVLLAGSGAAQAYFDFLVLSGGVTWLESVAQADALLPPLSRLQRWIGRMLHPVL